MGLRVIVRRGKPADARRFVSLLVALAKFEKLEPPSAESRKRIVEDVFHKKMAGLFVASVNGKLVGYALYFYTYSTFLAKPTLYLEDIFVLDAFRGLGAGKSLFLRCAREATRRRCGRMEWSVLNWNANAIRFYEKMGAKKLSEWSVFRLDERSLARLGKRTKS